MRQIVLAIIFLLLLSHGKVKAIDTLSVSSKHKLFISISGGIGITARDFSIFEKDYRLAAHNIAGFAKNGINGKFDLTYLFTEKLGINFMCYSSVHETEVPTVNELFPESGLALGGGSNRLSYNYNTKKWYTNGVLLGPVIGFGTGKIKFNLKFAGGVQRIESPETKLYEAGYTWQLNWPSTHPYSSSTIQSAITTYNFVFDSGLYFKINLKKKLDLLIAFDFLTSRATFKGQSSYTSDYYNGTTNTNTNTNTHTEQTNTLKFVKNISIACFNIGVSYAIK